MPKKYKEGDRILVKDYADVLDLLEKKGWEECSRGNWRKPGRATFYASMQDVCGREFIVTSVDSDGRTVHIEHYGPEYIDAGWIKETL